MNKRSASSAQSSSAIVAMTEQHRVQWLRMLNQLQAAQAPADQLELCQVQLIRLQGRYIYCVGDRFGHLPENYFNEFFIWLYCRSLTEKLAIEPMLTYEGDIIERLDRVERLLRSEPDQPVPGEGVDNRYPGVHLTVAVDH